MGGSGRGSKYALRPVALLSRKNACPAVTSFIQVAGKVGVLLFPKDQASQRPFKECFPSGLRRGGGAPTQKMSTRVEG